MWTKLYKVMAVGFRMALLLTQGVAMAATVQPGTMRIMLVGRWPIRLVSSRERCSGTNLNINMTIAQITNQIRATVLLKMDAADCVGFAMETPGTLATPAGEKHNPIGIGSPLTKKLPDFDPLNNQKNLGNADDTNDNGKVDDAENPYKKEDHGAVKNQQVLVWSASSARATETFYVVVKNQSKAACAYTLMISGPTVSFPQNPVVAPAPSPTPAPTAKASTQRGK